MNIEEIKAALREHSRISEQNNAEFRSSARNLSPIMAKVLLMFIEDCETCGIVSGEGMLKRIEPMWKNAS